MSKKLVAYFSITGNTRKAAEEISKLLNCDLYEIKAKIPYKEEDLQWGPCRSKREAADRTLRPELADKNAQIHKYDTIIIGFPVWSELAPSIILTFLEAYDFRKKKIVIWGTTWKSLMGNIMSEIRNIAKDSIVIEGVIFDGAHRNTYNYKKFVSNILNK